MDNLLDITIVTYNSRSHLKKLIESFLGQEKIDLGTVSLFFVDNGSGDGTVDLLNDLLEPCRDRFFGIKVTDEGHNGGFGLGQNLAVKQGEGQFVLILNPDIELHPLSLSILIESAKESENDVGAWEARQIPYEHPKNYDPVTCIISWSSAAALMVRRVAFEQIGGFDSTIFLYGEDVDLSWRLQDYGWKLKYIPRAMVWHYTYEQEDEIKPAAFIGSTRANLLLRTRFGSWRDIARGLGMQLGILLLPSRNYVPRRRREVVKTLLLFFLNWFRWRSGSERKVTHNFYGWDYSLHRQGAFFDAGEAVKTFDGQKDPLPKVSVLIRTVGREPLLRQALQSVANQTYRNIEVVVVEDGLATMEAAVKGYPDLLTIYHPLGNNQGRCIAGNEALTRATGDYMLFLDEDDLLYADHVEQLVATCLRKSAKVAYSYTFEIPSKITADTHEVVDEGAFKERFNRPFHFIPFLSLNFLPINAVIFHRSLYESCGGFDPELDMMEDWNLWVRFSLKFRPFEMVPKTTALYRVPMKQDHRLERRKKLIEFLHLAREKQARLPVQLQVSDIQDMSGGIVESVRLEEILVKRAPLLKRVIQLALRIYRRITGRV